MEPTRIWWVDGSGGNDILADPSIENGYVADVDVRMPSEDKYRPVLTVKLDVVNELVLKLENVGEYIFASTTLDTVV